MPILSVVVLSVRDTAEGPMIQLPETILFDSGLAKLKTKGEVALGEDCQTPYVSPFSNSKG